MDLKRTSDKFVLTVNGSVKEFPIKPLSEEFVEWNLGQRIDALEAMLSSIEGKEGHHKHGSGFGAHLPVYITNNPEDELFPVNIATKGTGFVAKQEYLDFYIDKFNSVFKETEYSGDSTQKRNESIRERVKTIREFYEDKDKIDLRCFAGLEIWPGRTTRNFMSDPRVSLHFVGMPKDRDHIKYNQWQINCIWEKIEPDDKRFKFGAALRQLTLGSIGKSFVPGHIPAEQTPIMGKYPFGWNLWVIEVLDKGIEALHH